MLKSDYDAVRKKAKQQLKIAQKATDTPEGTDLSDEYKGVSDLRSRSTIFHFQGGRNTEQALR